MAGASFYGGRKVLVTGGTGTIGTPLVRRLLDLGASVSVVSIDSPERVKAVLDPRAGFRRGDLRDPAVCAEAAKGVDYLFHCMAVKENTQIGVSRSASAYVPFLLCNTNMMEAAFRAGVSRYLFVGSINEYPPLEVRHEDRLWDGPPAANDRYVGIAKRAGEAQAEAYRNEHGWEAVRVVRPANVYGPYDDFDPKTAHVIPTLIARMVGEEDPVRVAGDGSAVRDFIYADDVVEGMLLALEKAEPCRAVNLGSGEGCSVKTLVETMAALMPRPPRVAWDPSKPSGDKKRVLDVARAKEVLGFTARTTLSEGLRRTIDWYRANRGLADRRGKELHG